MTGIRKVFPDAIGSLTIAYETRKIIKGLPHRGDAFFFPDQEEGGEEPFLTDAPKQVSKGTEAQPSFM